MPMKHGQNQYNMKRQLSQANSSIRPIRIALRPALGGNSGSLMTGA